MIHLVQIQTCRRKLVYLRTFTPFLIAIMIVQSYMMIKEINDSTMSLFSNICTLDSLIESYNSYNFADSSEFTALLNGINATYIIAIVFWLADHQ